MSNEELAETVVGEITAVNRDIHEYVVREVVEMLEAGWQFIPPDPYPSPPSKRASTSD